MTYHLICSEGAVRVVGSPSARPVTNVGVAGLPYIFSLAKDRAGWKEGGTGLQQVDGALEVKLIEAFEAVRALG